MFEKDNAWEKVLWKHAQTFSLWQITCVERMLACGSKLMGAKHYDCGTLNCPHTKVICQSCKTKACSSCGTKSTEQWINTQLDVMPDCEHQHITFTMPSELWPVFEANPALLNDLFSLAADTLLKWAKKHGLEIGVFGALHTYRRGLNWHPHIHLSVTRGGLDKHNTWQPIYFKKKHVEYPPCKENTRAKTNGELPKPLPVKRVVPLSNGFADCSPPLKEAVTLKRKVGAQPS